MGVYLSPGVYSLEKDLSQIVPNIATTTSALVGYSPKGNIDEIVLITNTQQFINEYGTPVNSSGNYFHYSALAFLEKGNKLYCYRVQDGAEYGALTIANPSETYSITESFTSTEKTLDTDTSYPGTDNGDQILFQIFGKDPGVWNHRIGITITDLKSNTQEWISGEWVPSSLLPIADTDQYTFVINVYYRNADNAWEKVESFTVSRKHKIDGYGRQLYMEDRINGYSQYIAVADHSDIADTVMPDGFEDINGDTTQVELGEGNDGTTYADISDGKFTDGWDLFANPDDVDIRVLINGGETSTIIQAKMNTIANARADCIAILDIPYSEMASATNITDMIVWRNADLKLNSSYAALYAPWVKIYDSYNDVLLYVPPSGYVVAQIAYNDYVSQPWYAPAGFNRGLLNVEGVYDIFTGGERDMLYEAQINPIQLFRGEGIPIWGQKTLAAKASALSRVNVRRLLIIIEKALSIALRQFVFEPNSEITRFRVEAMITEYLELLSTRGAFQTESGDRGYKVLCNETNNTPAIIDRNELHVDIFIKPSRSAEFIQLQTIVTTSGASFDELVARGVMF